MNTKSEQSRPIYRQALDIMRAAFPRIKTLNKSTMSGGDFKEREKEVEANKEDVAAFIEKTKGEAKAAYDRLHPQARAALGNFPSGLRADGEPMLADVFARDLVTFKLRAEKIPVDSAAPSSPAEKPEAVKVVESHALTPEALGSDIISLTTHSDPKISSQARAHVQAMAKLAEQTSSPHGRPMTEAAQPAKPVLVGGQPLPVLPVPSAELALQPDGEKLLAIKHIRKCVVGAIKKMDDRRDQDAYVRAVLELLPFSLRKEVAHDYFPQIGSIDPDAPEFRSRNRMPSAQTRAGEWMYVSGIETPGRGGAQVFRRFKLRFPWRGENRGEIEILESEIVEDPALTRGRETQQREESAATLEAHAKDFRARASALRTGGSVVAATTPGKGSAGRSIHQQYAAIADRVERRKFFLANREALSVRA